VFLSVDLSLGDLVPFIESIVTSICSTQLNEPALPNWMGSLHPNASLYEKPLDLRAAQREHAQFRYGVLNIVSSNFLAIHFVGGEYHQITTANLSLLYLVVRSLRSMAARS
jgi:hypothetical protein